MESYQRIRQSGCETTQGHRGDFETCPYCDYKMSYDHWYQMAHTLCLQPVIVFYGHASVLSECPKCYETSWIHRELNDIEAPQSWKVAAQKEAAAQKLAALRQWGASLCWRCVRLESGTVKYTTQRECEKGFGPAVKTCALFCETGESHVVQEEQK